LDLIAWFYFALLDHGEVHARVIAAPEALYHVASIESNVEFETGHARLSDLQDSGTDAILVTDKCVSFCESGESQVLAKGAWHQVGVGQFVEPVVVVFRGVCVNGLIGAAVYAQVGLPVAFYIVSSNGAPARNRHFEDAGQRGTVLQLHLTRLAHID
jgi:hypothetical protein